MYLFDSTDPKGRRVILRKSTFQEHILDDRNRREFSGYVDAIQQTIERPHRIRPSAQAPEANVYFRKGAHPLYPSLYVKVPVWFERGVGTVSTAQLQPDSAQGTLKGGEDIYVNWSW